MSWRGKTIAGFEGRDALARALAREIGASYASLSVALYRAGERVVRVSRPVSKHCLLVADLEADGESVWVALMAADALKRSGAKHVVLLAPWMAYGRQDRPAKTRESAGGVVLGAALSRAYRKIHTLDAHSKMFRKHFGGRLKSVTPRDLIVPIARAKGATAIAAPDKGAEKRAKAVARKMRLPFIQCEKKRLRPGLGGATAVATAGGGVRSRVSHGNPKGHRVLLVDDMVDSGGTLAEAAKALRTAGAKSVGAVVTHAASLSSEPSAKSLGLGYLEVVYRREHKPTGGLVKLLAAKV